MKRGDNLIPPKSVPDEALVIARAIVQGDIRPLFGLRKMQRFVDREIAFRTREEPGFTFAVVDTETDHLPLGDERSEWAAEALARKEVEINRLEQRFRDRIIAAAKLYIAHSGQDQSQSSHKRVK